MGNSIVDVVVSYQDPWKGLTTFFTVVLAYQISCYIYNIYFHPLAKIPGPKLWAASRLPDVIATCSGSLVPSVTALHMQYGEIVRTGPNAVSFIDPRAWEEIYAKRPGKSAYLFIKDPRAQFDLLQANKAYDILSAPPDQHARLRRLLSPVFSSSSLRKQEPLIQAQIGEFVQALRQRVQNNGSQDGHTVDMNMWLNCVGADIIGDLGFGESFDCSKKGEMHRWLGTISKSAKMATRASTMARFPWLKSLLSKMMAPKIDETFRQYRALAKDKVDRRLERGSVRGDFVDDLMNAKRGSAGDGLSQDEVYSNALFLILAGFETVATSLTGCLYYLTVNSATLRELTLMLRSSFATESDIEPKALGEIDLLTAVINESARLYSVVSFSIRVSLDEDTMVCDRHIPPGTAVNVCQQVANTYPKYFHNPSTWDPKRWMGHLDYKDDRREAFKPFSCGTRGCMGERLAWTEMRLIIARLLWSFDLELSEDSKTWRDQLIYSIPYRKNLWIKLSIPEGR